MVIWSDQLLSYHGYNRNSRGIFLFANIKLSEHQIRFQEVLGLATLRGSFPEHLHLIEVQPADISTGMDLSPAVAAVMDEVIRRARRVLQGW